MARDEFTRILLKTDSGLKRICSIHLNLTRKYILVEFKTIAGKPFDLIAQGEGKMDYKKGTTVSKTKGKQMNGVSHVHYLIDSNEALLTFRDKGGKAQHTSKIHLEDKKLVRFLRLIPDLNHFPFYTKKLGQLDFIFEDIKLFGKKQIFIDFWFGKDFSGTDQALLQGKLEKKYMYETGRICKVLGGSTLNFNVIIALYQPKDATDLEVTRIMLPGPKLEE